MKRFSVMSFISGVLTASVVLVPVLTFASGTQTIEAIFGKIKLVVNGQNINNETLLYNGTTYLPIRAIGEAIGAEVAYDAKSYTATLTTPSASVSDSSSTYWANKVYILATNTSIDANKLIISNVTNTSFNFEFKNNDNSILSGTANISGYSAVCTISDIYGLKFEIHGDEITVYETGKAQLYPDGTAAYVHKTAMKTEQTANTNSTETNKVTYISFKSGKYSSGSSNMAKTLIISDVAAGESFKYQVIAANGKDVVTEGTAKISSENTAECTFSDDYKISFTDLKNDVIELKESQQKLFAADGIKFYTM
ncbi:MAG: stalk domain-containing protein [Clostridia bacterium]|nr:stalk domain-containing protein [Clostridia bacterium]